MPNERLQKLISRAGVASRRVAEDMIVAGRITVNGEPAHLGQQADPGSDRIAVDGIPLPLNPEFVYRLLNKPVGVVSTASDPEGRRTVLDLVPAEPRVYPVGRLDINTGGLIILTNDGDFTNFVTHPRHGVTKTYSALVEGRVSAAELRQLTDGVELEDGLAQAKSARVLDQRGEETLLEISLGEGRNREVRRMCSALGHDVRKLFRTKIGPLGDSSLRVGRTRPLLLAEVRSIYQSGLDPSGIEQSGIEQSGIDRSGLDP